MPRVTKAVAKTATPPVKPGLHEIVDAEVLDDWFVPIDDTVDNTNAVFYGREGSGKTTAVARLANLAPVGSKILIINVEGGLKKVPLRKRGVDTSRIVVWPDPKKHERATYYKLDELHRRLKADLDNDPNSWFGVGIDSATEVYQAILDHVQEKRVSVLQNKGADVDPDFVDIADYGTMSKMFRDLMRKFRDLPCHVVFTALERRDVDKDTGKPQYGPAVTPGLQADLLGYVDFVLMLKAADEDGPYRALTRANSRYRAKDRYDVLPRVMAEPMYDRIIGYLSGDITEETDPFQLDLKPTARTAQDKVTVPDVDEEDADEPVDEK